VPDDSRSPAQVYALVVGVLLTALGIAGFFWGASFAIGTSAGVEQGFLLGILAVNGWHNVLHLITGVVGLAVAGDAASARLYTLAVGAIYLVLGILGFVADSNDALLGLFAVNAEANVLDLVIAVAGMSLGLVLLREPGARERTSDTPAGRES
jgi:hypothetical protein